MRVRLSLILLLPSVILIAGPAKKEQRSGWRRWIEMDFPFFSTAVDARPHGIKNNLTPRGLVFPLGQDCFLAWDVDLLRVAVVWRSSKQPFSKAGMAVNSYPYQLKKVGAGQRGLPRPIGEIWLQNGLYPGVSISQPQFADPRPPQPSRQEPGRGGVDPKLARFLGVDPTTGGIEYEIGGKVLARERFSLEKEGLIRRLKISAHTEPVVLVLARGSVSDKFQCRGNGGIETVEGHTICRIPPADNEESLSIVFLKNGQVGPARAEVSRRWKESVRLPLPAIATGNPLNLELIPVPKKNPYGRGVRLAAVDFFSNGRAAVVTFDGDVWLCDGLRPGDTEVVWTRFTSGLHEPLSLRIRNDEVFVFDRSGLWRLMDRDKNGEADYHELFCSQIDQTAETREFVSAMELENEGSFLVAKPGQRAGGGTRSSSAILRVSADGKTVSRIAHGFRQPFLGYDPKTGQIAATDQQGNYVPSTPIDFIRAGAFYGYVNSRADRSRLVTPPLTWIPHFVCGSASSIVWARKSKMGPLADAPVLLAYHPPRLLQIHTDVDEIVTQGAVTPLDLKLDFAPLKGAINPADGLLYLAGFKIWGTKAKGATFLGRVRPNLKKTWPVPVQVRVERRGILLQFAAPLRVESAARVQAYTVRRWNYKRTRGYGSPLYKLDGRKGTERLLVASAKVSEDRRSVFLGVPGMREAMQVEVGYDISAADGTRIRRKTFLTAHLLRSLDLTRHGFPDNRVDLDTAGLPPVVKRTIKPTAEEGKLLHIRLGCIACHSIDGSTDGKTGPSWLGLYGSKRKLTKSDKVVVADDDYLRESILNPPAKVAEGAVNGDEGMPSYEGALEDGQLESLLLYIKSLKKVPK